jgi:hypothetical protein
MPAAPDGDSSHTPPGKEDTSPGRHWLKRPVVWVGALITAVITGVLVNLVTGAVSNAAHGGPAPNIEIDSVTAQYVPSHDGIKIPARPVKLDFEIRNTGDQLAIIKAAKVTVQQFAALPVCFSAGALVSTGTYRAVMPFDPSPGKSVEIPTAQQVAPDSADRFDVTLGLPAKHPPENIYIYRIHIELLYNNSDTPVDAGEAVMALPVAPYSGYFWTKQYAAQPTNIPSVIGGPIPTVNRCLVNNSRKLHGILTMAGARPPQLGTVQAQLSTCCGWTPPAVKAQQVCGPALERPSVLSTSCDGTGVLENMRWSAWTSSYAQGTGVFRGQSCDPDCASGQVRHYDVSVRLDMPTNEGKNGWLWDRMTLDFPNGSPTGRSPIVLNNLAGG